jgi:hypothetical protein
MLSVRFFATMRGISACSGLHVGYKNDESL